MNQNSVPTLSIVIVTSNTRELLRNCLTSVFEHAKGLEREVIVVDNNSTDGTAEMVRTVFPSVKLICNKENLGFSKGNNQGFAASSGRYILALNSDTIVPDSTIPVVVRFMDEHPEAAAVGCRTVNAEGALQLTYERFPTLLSDLFYTTWLNRLFAHNVGTDRGGYLEVDWVQGSFLMLRRAAVEKVGFFDEIYSPAYSEETDLCYRLKRAGWLTYYVSTVAIVHLGGGTTKSNETWHFLQLHRSKFLFFKKHRGALYAHTFRYLRASLCLVRMVLLAGSLTLKLRQGEDAKKRLNIQWRLFRFLLDPRLRLPDSSR